MLKFLRTTTFRVIAFVAVLIALYAIAGFVVAPRMLRSALLEDLPKSMGVTPTVGEIRINPFLFQMTVDNLSLSGRGGEKLVGFERLFVDFELSSIWHRAYSFAVIDITSPHVAAAVAKDGSLNLLQLQPKPALPAKPKQTNEPLPAIRIGSFKVSQGLVTYEDRSRPDVFAARLEPINFELREFTTGVEGGKFTFTGSSKLGERIEWHGHLSVQPIESDGEFQIKGLLAHTLWEYLQDRLNFVVDAGAIDLGATYKFSQADLQIDLSRLALRDLTVRPKNAATATATASAPAAEPWITLPEFTVTGATVDLASRRAQVERVSLTGLKLAAWLEAGSVNLLTLAAVPGAPPAAAVAAVPATPPVPTLTAGSTVPAAAVPPWRFDVREFELRDASIAAEDRTTHPSVKVLLEPVSLKVSGVSQDLTQPVRVALDTRINRQGSLTASGDVTPQPLMANLSIKLAGLDLTAVQPYIAQHTALTLLGGTLGGEATVHYGAQKGSPALSVAGNVNVSQLHSVDNTLHDDFVNCERLDILGLRYTRGPDRLDIDQVVARKLYATAIIESDESTNIKRVLTGPGSAAPGLAAASPPPPAAPARARAPAAPAPTASAASQSMPMSIKKIVVQAGQANFADLSVTPNFSTGIQKLGGSIVGLSSKPGSRAKVDLQGAIDTFSPVSITGEVSVLGPLYTDLSMSFRNISLPVFNPYSGKFAGYNITKGKLTTEFHYKVDGRKLDARHHIIVEQLEFGDKTASKDAVSLPIKLAVALLKDRNGVIDLNLPVTGSLDDPQFRLAPIIWKVLVGVLEKAVTEPFALLGSLFGSGPEIQFIDFRPGVSTLDPAAAERVNAVAKALLERPQLSIDVPIAVIADIDRPALAAEQFDAQLASAQASASGAKTATQLDLLTQVYVKDFGAEPKFPDAVTSLKSKPDVVAAKIDFLSTAIHEHIVVGEAELTALGQQRAMALQQALLADPQVTPERVFLVANDKAALKDGVVRLELSLR